MGWDAALIVEVDGQEVDILRESWNYTHNMNPAMREAGCGPEDLDGLTGQEAMFSLCALIAELRTNAEKYRTMEPPNGWGSLDTLIPLLQKMAMGCRKFPSATMRVDL